MKISKLTTESIVNLINLDALGWHQSQGGEENKDLHCQQIEGSDAVLK